MKALQKNWGGARMKEGGIISIRKSIHVKKRMISTISVPTGSLVKKKLQGTQLRFLKGGEHALKRVFLGFHRGRARSVCSAYLLRLVSKRNSRIMEPGKNPEREVGQRLASIS